MELMKLEQLTSNEYHKAVARLLDERINRAYRLYPNNYIAYDLRYGTKIPGFLYPATEGRILGTRQRIGTL